MGEIFEVRYVWTTKLFSQFVKTCTFSKRDTLLVCWGPIGLLIIFLFACFGFSKLLGLQIPRVLVNGILFGLLLGVFTGFLKAKAQRNVALQRLKVAWDARGEVVVSVGPQGISEKTSTGTVDHFWSSIYDVAALEKGLSFNILGTFFIPLPDENLPEGLSRAEALKRITEWRNA